MSVARGAKTYPLRDTEGRLVALHVREDAPDGSKQVRWRQPDGQWGLNGTPLRDLPLYGSESISDLGEDELIVVVEGEKARDALEAAGLPSVGTVTGAGGTPGSAALEVLKNRRVVLWPDADEPGRCHMRRVAEGLDGHAVEVLEFSWDEAPEKGDAADHPAVRSRDTKAVDRLLTALEGSPRWKDGRGTETHDEVGRLLSEVEAESVRWLWPAWVPYGKLTILDGDPGNGKSAMTMDLAARVSAGRPLPDGTPREPAGVVLMNAEDGLADTIRPRLEVAGADLDRILALATAPDGEGSERLLSVPEDLGMVRRGIERVRAALVVLDPLMAFVSGGVNTHKDQDVRRALAPLAKLAEETGAAVVVVRHLNQATGQNALYRGGGSIGIIGQARSAMLVAKDPEDEDRRVLAPLKNNLAAPAPSLAFALSQAANGAVRVEWRGETHHGAEALLSAPTNPEERSALDEAVEFLRDALKDGPMWSKEVKKAAREADVSEITLKRAKGALGVKSRKEADGSWSWSLAQSGTRGGEGDQRDPHAPYPSKDDPVDPLDPLPVNKPTTISQGDQGAQGDHVLAVAPTGDPDALTAFLAEPDEWWRRQAEVCVREGTPDRLLSPLASATATAVYGGPHRWREVLPKVRKRLEGVVSMN